VVTRVPDGWPTDTQVLSVDLDVRERSDADAADAMAQAIARLGAHLVADVELRVFVKIDSTLRGPLAGLVAGALGASGRSIAIVAPAFPEQGRHIRNGYLVVNGQTGPSLFELLGHLDVTVVDAEDTVTLAGLARASQAHPEWLLVGSAGLARQLAPPHAPARPRVDETGPLLIVAGSPTPVTRVQIDHVPALDDVVVLATPPTDTRDAGEAAAGLATSVEAWAREHTPRAIVLTGGATAREVSHRLGASSLRLRGELQPGIPVGTLEDGRWHGVTVVTKAGGFGTPRTLLDVVDALGVSSSERRA
jgi:uncharacterized protein YgbK (DUF1537 family)